MMGLPYGEEIMIVGRTVWTQSTSVTDRRTGGRTDGRTYRITTTKTVRRIASHGKNGQESVKCAVIIYLLIKRMSCKDIYDDMLVTLGDDYPSHSVEKSVSS